MDEGKTRPKVLVGERGGSGYTLFNFRLMFVNQVYHEVRDGKKVLIKEVAMKEEKAGLSPALVAR
mgnify:CR=1 FL=1